MPGKANKNVLADPMDANAYIENSFISLGANYLAEPFDANADIIDSEITTVFEASFIADALLASADAGDAEKVQAVNIFADIFIASAILNEDIEPKITIPAMAMLATASFGFDPRVNNQTLTNLSAYMRYVRSQSFENTSIPLLTEIK
jgi:hypothetical protein